MKIPTALAMNIAQSPWRSPLSICYVAFEARGLAWEGCGDRLIHSMAQHPVVVLGASGFIGTRLINHLTSNGARGLRALDLKPPRQRFVGVEYARGDIRAPIPEDIGRGASVIFNLAATHRTPGHHEHEYFEDNIGGALNAVALAKACDIKTIVFTSSISVYGFCEQAVSEASPLRPISAYGRSKRLAEDIHRQWLASGTDRRLIIVRPGVVFGPGERGNYTALANALHRGYFFYPGRRDTVKSGGYVDELIRTIEFALERVSRYALFNFAYPEQNTIREIVAAFGKVSGRRYDPLMLPLPLLKLVAGVIGAGNAIGLHAVIHPDRVMKLVQSTRVRPMWLASQGYEFSTNLETALERWRDETQGRFD